jgi:hypothetical protein
MDFITYAEQAMKEALPGIIGSYSGEIRAGDLSEMERDIKQLEQAVGNEIMKQWLEAQDEQYPAATRPCRCGEQAKYVRRRAGMSITLQGRVYYKRAYYGCPEGGQGHYPLDEHLGIRPGEMSEEVVKQAALLGVQDAFGTAHDILKELTLLELSPSSIHKASLMMGERVLDQEEELKQPSQSLDSQLAQRRRADKPSRLYGSLDGFMVPLEEGWHEMKAGTWWTTRQRRDGSLAAQAITYYVDLLPAEQFADLVWARGFERQANQAQELVFVADGAHWIWDIVEQHFPQAVQIVDWYHACHYLAPVAQIAGDTPPERLVWLEQTTAALWDGHLDEVIAACSEHIRPHLKPEEDPAQRAATYYSNNRHRMDYPSDRNQGYMIGSGSMERGCKQLGSQRLKSAGARWSPDGARKLAKARAAYLSGDWSRLVSSEQALSQAA